MRKEKNTRSVGKARELKILAREAFRTLFAIRNRRPISCLAVPDWVIAAHLSKRGEYQAAVAYFQRGLDRNPGIGSAKRAIFGKAYASYRLGNIEEAKEILSEIVFSAEQFADGLILSYRLARATDDEQLLEALNKHVEHYSELDPLVFVERVHSSVGGLLSPEILEDTKRELMAFIASAPGLSSRIQRECHTALAHLEYVYGSKQRALEIVTRVLAEGRAPFEAILLRARIFLVDKRVAPARAQFERALRIRPSDARALAGLAQTYLCDKEPKFEWAFENAFTAARLTKFESRFYLELLVEAGQKAGREEELELYRDRLRSFDLEQLLKFDDLKRVEKNLLCLRELA